MIQLLWKPKLGVMRRFSSTLSKEQIPEILRKYPRAVWVGEMLKELQERFTFIDWVAEWKNRRKGSLFGDFLRILKAYNKKLREDIAFVFFVATGIILQKKLRNEEDPPEYAILDKRTGEIIEYVESIPAENHLKKWTPLHNFRGWFEKFTTSDVIVEMLDIFDSIFEDDRLSMNDKLRKLRIDGTIKYDPLRERLDNYLKIEGMQFLIDALYESQNKLYERASSIFRKDLIKTIKYIKSKKITTQRELAMKFRFPASYCSFILDRLRRYYKEISIQELPRKKILITYNPQT